MAAPERRARSDCACDDDWAAVDLIAIGRHFRELEAREAREMRRGACACDDDWAAVDLIAIGRHIRELEAREDRKIRRGAVAGLAEERLLERRVAAVHTSTRELRAVDDASYPLLCTAHATHEQEVVERRTHTRSLGCVLYGGRSTATSPLSHGSMRADEKQHWKEEERDEELCEVATVNAAAEAVAVLEAATSDESSLPNILDVAAETGLMPAHEKHHTPKVEGMRVRRVSATFVTVDMAPALIPAQPAAAA